MCSWKGVLHEAKERYNEAQSDSTRKDERADEESVCPACHGEKIKPYPAATTVGGKRIAEVTAMAIDDALRIFSKSSS